MKEKIKIIMKYRILFVTGLFLMCNQVNAQKVNTGKVMADVEKQTKVMLTEIDAAREDHGEPYQYIPLTGWR